MKLNQSIAHMSHDATQMVHSIDRKQVNLGMVYYGFTSITSSCTAAFFHQWPDGLWQGYPTTPSICSKMPKLDLQLDAWWRTMYGGGPSIYVYIYIYVYMYICVCICIYIYTCKYIYIYLCVCSNMKLWLPCCQDVFFPLNQIKPAFAEGISKGQ